jgi:hypothetical protein
MATILFAMFFNATLSHNVKEYECLDIGGRWNYEKRPCEYMLCQEYGKEWNNQTFSCENKSQ